MWAQDEHQLGLKPLLRHVWVPRGERPTAPVHHRFQWSYLYGFVQPQSGQVFFLILPLASIVAFSIALEHFAKAIGAGVSKRVLLLIDQAAWHLSQIVVLHEGIHLIHLPPYSPELQPAERLWLLTDEPLENRHFDTIEELEALLAERCVVLQGQPEVVRAHTYYHWLPSGVNRPQGGGCDIGAYEVEVERASQSISFTSTAPINATVGGTYEVSATATSGLAVSFASTTIGVCTVSGSTVSFIAGGTCTIEASQAGNGFYHPAESITQSFSVHTATTTVSPLGPGHWKNSPAETSALLAQALGSFSVETFTTASAVFNKMNCSSTKTDDAVACLAGHLLAAKLNVANGSDTCINAATGPADNFLISINYTGPSGSYTLDKTQRQTTLSLKDTLDNYNNGLGCL